MVKTQHAVWEEMSQDTVDTKNDVYCNWIDILQCLHDSNNDVPSHKN